jgi:hypothetical protein
VRAGERAGTGRSDFRYDTALIKEWTERLLAAYLGRPGKVSGSRLVWDCPKCGKAKLSLLRSKGSVGCMNAGCTVEANTDVIGVIASLENLQTRGEDFKKVCALSYELLSIPDPAPGEAVGDGEKAASEEREPEREPPVAETGDDGAGEPEEVADGGREPLDAYDRWYALLEGHPGSSELASPPRPYRPRDGEGPAPGDEFVQEAELQWAGLFGLAVALAFWYYAGASDGWLPVGTDFLPSLPGPLAVAAGLPFALLLGVAAGALLVLHLRGRRLATRRHLLGPGRRRHGGTSG